MTSPVENGSGYPSFDAFLCEKPPPTAKEIPQNPAKSREDPRRPGFLEMTVGA